MNKKALIAMSGGVDSSVAAYLMKQRGFDCIGCMMKLFEDTQQNIKGACCTLADAEDARHVADTLGIPFYIYNFIGDFRYWVIDRFVKSYQDGATPNPCIDCNRYIKFGILSRRAEQLGMDYIATGHYARIEHEISGRYLLKKARDKSKDQSYFLYTLTQTELARIMFPLGDMTKTEIRETAEQLTLVTANKNDSQDICFVRNNGYADFIEHYTGEICESGYFVDLHGNILGEHKGLIRYTIGQRKGLGLAFNKPMYVHSKNTEENTVVLCEEELLYGRILSANDFNWIAYEKPNDSIRCKAKVRYSQKEDTVRVEITEDGVLIEFDNPQRAVTKGQAVVLYDDDVVIGGGTIC